jgi:hypothetical protein
MATTGSDAVAIPVQTHLNGMSSIRCSRQTRVARLDPVRTQLEAEDRSGRSSFPESGRR